MPTFLYEVADEKVWRAQYNISKEIHSAENKVSGDFREIPFVRFPPYY